MKDTLTTYQLFWIFFIGCFLGVALESIWCVLRNKRIESRTGLVYGPFNLVYGFGALLMTLLLSRLAGRRDLWIFACGALIGGLYEYLCSVVQETLFGTVSWDYGNFPLNLHGRINLLYCFFWGLLALVWVKDFLPRVCALIARIPPAVGHPLALACFVFMVFNSILSACVVYRMQQRHAHIAPSCALWRRIDRRYPDERVEKIYPNMKFVDEREPSEHEYPVCSQSSL